MPLVLGDLFIERFDHLLVALQYLEERSSLVKEHSGDAELAVVSAACVKQTIKLLSGKFNLR